MNSTQKLFLDRLYHENIQHIVAGSYIYHQMVKEVNPVHESKIEHKDIDVYVWGNTAKIKGSPDSIEINNVKFNIRRSMYPAVNHIDAVYESSLLNMELIFINPQGVSTGEIINNILNEFDFTITQCCLHKGQALATIQCAADTQERILRQVRINNSEATEVSRRLKLEAKFPGFEYVEDIKHRD